MPEPLNAPEPVAIGQAELTVMNPSHKAGWPLSGLPLVVTGYVWPDDCSRCVPVVRVVSDSYFVRITEISHEVACKNHPQHNTRSLSKESAW